MLLTSLYDQKPDKSVAEEERKQNIFRFVDLLFPFFQEDKCFQIWQAIGNYQTSNGLEYSNPAIMQMLDMDDEIAEVMIEKGFAERQLVTHLLKLTPSGINHKNMLEKSDKIVSISPESAKEKGGCNVSFSEGVILIIVMIALGLFLLKLGEATYITGK